MPHVRAGALSERDVYARIRDPELSLGLEERRDSLAWESLAGAADEYPDRAPVDLWETLHVEQGQAVSPHQLAQRLDTEVREVLVVDGVELVLFDEVEKIGDLDDEDPARGEGDLHGVGEFVEIIDVRKHVRRRRAGEVPGLPAD